MKRILFISLSNLLLLTACGTSASKNIPSDTQISNSIDSTISTNEKNSPVETSDIKVSTSAKNRVKKLSARLLYFKQTLNQLLHLLQQIMMIVSRLLLTKCNLLQMLYDNKPELNDPDISFAFFEMIGSDDLFKNYQFVYPKIGQFWQYRFLSSFSTRPRYRDRFSRRTF